MIDNGWVRVNSVRKKRKGITVKLTKDVDCRTCYFRINCYEDCAKGFGWKKIKANG